MRANDSHPGIARCEIDERVGNFGCITFPLIIRRDAVSDFGDAVGTRRTRKTGHADEDVVDLVDDGETELPRIAGSGSLEFRNKIGRSAQKLIADLAKKKP